MALPAMTIVTRCWRGVGHRRPVAGEGGYAAEAASAIVDWLVDAGADGLIQPAKG